MPTLHQPGDKAWNDNNSDFGPRVNPVTGAQSFHSGMDYGWGDGWNVYAALDGVVEIAYYGDDYNQGWGGRIVIDHGNGIKTAYAHLNANSDRGVYGGHRVTRGQPIAWIGNPTTGTSTGPHLHFELYIDGERVNPWPYFTQNVPRVAGGSGGGETADIAAGQRKVGPDGVKRRSQPSSQSAEAGEPLAPGDVGNFVGWIRDESVEGNNIWYQGTSGHFFWSGAFEGGANTAGLKDLNPVQVAANQRVVGPDGVKRRIKDANTQASTGEPLAPGDVGNFTHWRTGESIKGNDLWYLGTSGDYFWSGGFTTISKDGLQEMKTAPPAVSSNQRVVGSSGVVGRDKPTTQGSVLQEFKAGEVLDFKGYVDGEDVWGDGNTAWLVGAYSGAFFHSSRFTDPSVGSLPNLTTATPPAVPPVAKPQVDQAYKSFKADSPLATWVGSPNYNWRAPRPAGEQPLCITDHWMAGTLAGTDAQFQKYSELKDGRGDGSASNYGVGQIKIHQYVREQDYQQANGHQESNIWSLSIEHEAGPGAPATDAVIDLAARLKADIALRYGWSGYAVYDGDVDAFRKKSPEDQLKLIRDFNSQNPGIRLVFPHKAWVSTACPGDLPSQKIVLKANELLNQVSTEQPKPQPKPQPDGDGETVNVNKSWLRKLIEDAQRILGKK